MLGLTIELWSPGAVLPGVVGGVSLLLAFFALQMLPVNYAGLLLILLGLLLLVLEIKVTSYGLLTAGGAGEPHLRLDDPDRFARARAAVEPAVRVCRSSLGFAAIAVLPGAARRRGPAAPPVTGVDGHDRRRRRRADGRSSPERPGRVSTHGEIWQAVADEPIAEGRTGSRHRTSTA